jgi:hypothetical protein
MEYTNSSSGLSVSARVKKRTDKEVDRCPPIFDSVRKLTSYLLADPNIESELDFGLGTFIRKYPEFMMIDPKEKKRKKKSVFCWRNFKFIKRKNTWIMSSDYAPPVADIVTVARVGKRRIRWVMVIMQ